MVTANHNTTSSVSIFALLTCIFNTSWQWNELAMSLLFGFVVVVVVVDVEFSRRLLLLDSLDFMSIV